MLRGNVFAHVVGFNGSAEPAHEKRKDAVLKVLADAVVLPIALHADDFGFNRAIDAGIVRGFEDGLLTSTSLLANAPEAASALDAWRQLAARQSERILPSMPRRQALGDRDQPFDLGVHLNLTQGRPLTGQNFPDELLDK